MKRKLQHLKLWFETPDKPHQETKTQLVIILAVFSIAAAILFIGFCASSH